MLLSPQKTYQYGCDLVSAAQRTRQSHSFDPHTSSSLLTELTLSWEKLTTAITENRERLLAAKEFHSIAEEVCVCVVTMYSQFRFYGDCIAHSREPCYACLVCNSPNCLLWKPYNITAHYLYVQLCAYSGCFSRGACTRI